MHLIYYWRGDNYRRDLDMGAGYHLNQSNPVLHDVELGESLWAFTKTIDGRYVLAAELVAKAKTKNPPNFRYGPYRIWGDLESSRYFEVDSQPNMEMTIRNLSCRAEAKHLGQSFQGKSAVRIITNEDHKVLISYAEKLDKELRATLIAEDELEATIHLGNSEAVKQLVRREGSGLAEERRKYLYSQAVTRNRDIVIELQGLYKGKCQVCSWDPKEIFGFNICQGHHLYWLSRGGKDEIKNLALLCPNHHQIVHRCDAQFDHEERAFVFGKQQIELQLNEHIPSDV